jgi:hypothetical protein
MTQLIRLTESDLHKIVEETVRRTVDEGWGKDALKTAGIGAAFGLGATGTLATDNPISRGLDRQFADQEEVGRAFPEDRAEFGKALSPRGNAEDNTISWEKANQFEGKIRMAVMESINKIISEIGDTPRGQYMLGRLQGRQMKNGNRNAAMNTNNYAAKQMGNRTPDNFQNFDTKETANNLGYNDEKNPQLSQDMMNGGGSIGNYQANVRNNHLRGISKF